MTMLQHGMVGSETSAYTVSKSVRFSAIRNAYIARVPSAAGNRQKLAMRFRIKRGDVIALQVIASAGTTSIDRFYFDTSNRLCLDVLGTTRLVTTPIYRDPTAWFVDVGFELDVANATATSRAKILIDGVEVGAYTTDTRSAITATDTNWNNTVTHYIGRQSAGNYFDGYIAEPVLVDGSTAITYSDGAGNPIQPSATYGTNGFYLPFSDGTSLSTLTADASGNGNDWTATNIGLTAGVDYDWMEDSPSNNFATINNLVKRWSVASELFYRANLQASNPGASSDYYFGTVLVDSGKWYWEVTIGSIGASSAASGVGVDSSDLQVSSRTSTVFYMGSGQKEIAGSLTTYGASFTTNDVISVLLDKDSNTVEFYKNGVSQGVISLPTSVPMSIAGAAGLNGGNHHLNCGQRPFSYSVPSGYQTLSSANLTNTTIVTSGSFTGNANANGVFEWINGVPTALTINGNPVTWGSHADKTAGGFKLRTSSASYNSSGTNTYSVTSTGAAFKNANAQVNP